MTAAALPTVFRDFMIVFEPDDKLPRRLRLSISGYSLSVMLFRLERECPLCYGSATLDQCRLDRYPPELNSTLWLNGIAFDVTAKEAERIAELFAKRGLKVESRK